jgi:hypothetical protein
MFIYPNESKQIPLPLSAKIFMGTEKPPTPTTSTPTTSTPATSTPTTSTPTPPTPTTPTTTPSIPTPSIPIPSNRLDVKMKRNYERLVSLCEKVVN